MLDNHYVTMAFQLARQGSTRGMVAQKLKQEGIIDAEQLQRILDKAYAAIARRKRIQGVAQIAAGITLLVPGMLIFGWLSLIKFACATGVCGLMLIFLGCFNIKFSF